jgi:hypothetical protein
MVNDGMEPVNLLAVHEARKGNFSLQNHRACDNMLVLFGQYRQGRARTFLEEKSAIINWILTDEMGWEELDKNV